MRNFDHLIIGSGQASATLIAGLLRKGESIGIVEEHKIGGSCVNYGCTPTKTLVASAKAFHMAGRGEDYGFDTEVLKLDFRKVMNRMNSIRNESNENLKNWYEDEENIELIRGRASFISDVEIEVEGSRISANKIYINVGTRAYAPPIKGIEQVSWLDSEKLLELEKLPDHLLIIGGGYVGVEFAQIFRRFGSEVTLIQRGEQLMPAEDTDVAKAIRELLEDEGVEVLCSEEAEEIRDNGKEIEIITEKRSISGSHLLIATGRKPNSDRLKVENAGIRINENGYIVVDEYCRTNSENVFAVGDVNGKGAFTHTSVNDAEIVLDFLIGGNRKLSDRIPVYALFSDPPLGKVGLSEKEALENGHKVLRSIMPMSEISRAKEMSETKGFAKLLVDGESDKILGAAILGPGGDEIINMFAAIMHSGIPCKKYREVVLVHPTVSELMPWALDSLEEVN